jgi:hypothetical protein
MARASKTSTSKAITTWDEELAKQAEVAADMESSSATGQFFSLKGGMLSWNDAPLPGNQMAVVILDSIIENTYYQEAYDPDSPSGPSCFAFGRDEKTMGPHDQVVALGLNQSPDCDSCPMNQWGSADKGRGKACRNSRRLAMIPAGSFSRSGEFELIDDLEHYETADVGYMKIPPTSITGYATFVKQTAGALRRPPHGIITKVRVVPDSKSQFKVVFEPIMNVPNELMGAIMKRNGEAKSLIDFPYQPNDVEEQPKKQARGKVQKQTPARSRKY